QPRSSRDPQGVPRRDVAVDDCALAELLERLRNDLARVVDDREGIRFKARAHELAREAARLAAQRLCAQATALELGRRVKGDRALVQTGDELPLCPRMVGTESRAYPAARRPPKQQKTVLPDLRKRLTLRGAHRHRVSNVASGEILEKQHLR